MEYLLIILNIFSISIRPEDIGTILTPDSTICGQTNLTHNETIDRQIKISTYTNDNIPDIDIIKVLKKLKGFRVGHLNITSLTKHIDQLRIYLHDETFEISSINESRLDSNIDDCLVKIKGYNIVRKDRNRDGGGVAIYYRNHLNVIIRDDLIHDELESICLEITKSRCKPLFIASIYRSPSAKIEILCKIHNFIQKMDHEHQDIIMVGDLNCDFLSKTKTSYTNQLKDMLELFQIK